MHPLADIFIQTHREMREAWPQLLVPRYEELEVGRWKLTMASSPVLLRGYFSGLQPGPDTNWVLMENKRIWMSVTPMELESQSHHSVAAKGKVLIGGFGLGVLAWNVANKSNVKSITVIEMNPEIIDIANRLLDLPGWENLKSKLTIVEADMLAYKDQTTRFDYALLDIWPDLGQMSLRPDLQRIARNVKAKEYAAWGMELDFISWCNEVAKIPTPDRIRAEDWSRYSASIGVPLIMRKNTRMAKMALRAAGNVIQY